MEQFSSCYFCGDAVDASLDEYPVVPASVDPGAATRRQIVLCASCKRKLDPVVEAVVDAAGDATVSLDRSNTDVREQETAGTDPGDGGPGDESDGDPATAADIGTTLGDDEDVLRPVGSDDTTDEETDDGEERPDDQGDGRRYTSGQRAGGRPTGDDEDGDGGDDRERETTLTRLENTSVMRLLQNREFPVDREEFVTVAASAYELSPSHCEKVVDLAVSHDLLDERDGELHAGEKWG
jgi:hypothetical protein